MQNKISETRIPVVVYLTKDEIDSLKEFSDENLALGTVELIQECRSGIGFTTRIMVKDLPETLTDITDVSSW